MAKKPEKFIIANDKKEKNIKNLLNLAINNNHLLLNQFMLSLKVLKKTLSSLSNIFAANIPLLPELFLNLANKENIPELLNIL